MSKNREIGKKIGTMIAAAALKTGTFSAEKSCRFTFYQNRIPAAMVKLIQNKNK